MINHFPVLLFISLSSYNPYIGDGDSKAYRRVQQEQPYGEAFPVRKEECVGHVQKRMGTNLRKLLDAKKGRLPYAEQVYYSP